MIGGCVEGGVVGVVGDVGLVDTIEVAGTDDPWELQPASTKINRNPAMATNFRIFYLDILKVGTGYLTNHKRG